jgi:hypothetical protein
LINSVSEPRHPQRQPVTRWQRGEPFDRLIELAQIGWQIFQK